MKYPIGSIKEVIKATHDTKENIFFEFFCKQTIPSILKEKPDLIGISVTYPSQLIPGFTLAYLIKKADKKIYITIGGSFISMLSESLMKNKEIFSIVDSFIIHEGELALLQLVRQLEGDRCMEKVPNIIYCKDRKVYANKEVFIKDLDSLPTPSFEGLPMGLYLSPEPVILLPITRGCYWRKCAFCTIYSSITKQYRERSAELIIKDIQYLSKKYRVKSFSFSVDVVHPQLLKSISSLLLDNNLDIRWDCAIRLEKEYTTELCQLMAQAGCQLLRFGLESACQRILNLMEKGIDIKTTENVLHNCYRTGIKTSLYLIIGFPTETKEEARETLDFLLTNREMVSFIALHIFCLEKGSNIEKVPEHFGIEKIYEDKTYSPVEYKYKAISGMSMAEVRRLRDVFEKELNKPYSDFYFLYFRGGGNNHSFLYSSHYDRESLKPFASKNGNIDTKRCVQNLILEEDDRLIPFISDIWATRRFKYNPIQIEKILKEMEGKLNELTFEKMVSLEEAKVNLEKKLTPFMPIETNVLYDINNYRMFNITSDSETISLLALCNGKSTVREILLNFSENGDKSPAKGFVKMLNLVKNGVIEVRKEIGV
jgi:radical SAM superfamily enzyme YgiQ (UPF0313 family)